MNCCRSRSSRGASSVIQPPCKQPHQLHGAAEASARSRRLGSPGCWLAGRPAASPAERTGWIVTERWSARCL